MFLSSFSMSYKCLYSNVLYACVFQPNGNAYSSDSQGLVTIKMKPDPQGRFGFNVKVRESNETSLYIIQRSLNELVYVFSFPPPPPLRIFVE